MRKIRPISPYIKAVCTGLLCAAFFGGCGGSPWLERAVVPGSEDWTQEGGNAQRTHAHAAVSEARNEIWEFSLDASGGRAGLLLRGETVMFPSVTMIVEAADLRDGSLIGAFPTAAINAGTPAILHDRLYIASMATEAALRCFSLQDGRLQWTRRIAPVKAALCAHDGAVFAAAMQGSVYCFRGSDSTAQWSRELASAVEAAPAAWDSILVVVTDAGDVHGLSTRTGATIWRVPTFAALQAGPVILGSRVVVVNREGRVLAIDVYSGQVLWEQQLQVPVYYTPAAQPERIVIPLSSGDLVILDPATGSVESRIALNELPGASPQLVGDTAYQLLRKGVLLRVDLVRGGWEIVYTLPLRSQTPPLLTPRGIVLVDEDGEAVLVGTGSPPSRSASGEMP